MPESGTGAAGRRKSSATGGPSGLLPKLQVLKPKQNHRRERQEGAALPSRSAGLLPAHMLTSAMQTP